MPVKSTITKTADLIRYSTNSSRASIVHHSSVIYFLCYFNWARPHNIWMRRFHAPSVLWKDNLTELQLSLLIIHGPCRMDDGGWSAVWQLRKTRGEVKVENRWIILDKISLVWYKPICLQKSPHNYTSSYHRGHFTTYKELTGKN